jgi:hypothetical protein
MENLHLLLIIVLLGYILSNNKKEGFAALSEAQKNYVRTFAGDARMNSREPREILGQNNFNKVSDFISILTPLNVMISANPTGRDANPDVVNTRTELTNRGIDITKLRDNIADCIIQIIEQVPDNAEDPSAFIAVIVSPSFSSKLNSIFLDLNKIDIAALSKASGMNKDQFCQNIPFMFNVAQNKEQGDRRLKEAQLMNQILSAYKNLIMMVYLFIMKNLDSISLYCGGDNTQHYKEFKKLFETVRTAMITKEDLEAQCPKPDLNKLCPKPEPEKICASYIKEASTCNMDLASAKKQRTTLIVLVVILIIAVIFLAMKK